MNFLKLKSTLAMGALLAAISMSSCNGGNTAADNKADSSATGNSDANTLIGAGSSFDNPLFSKMFSEYNKLNGLRVNYQSVGSGAGISQLTNKTVDFGFSSICTCASHTCYSRSSCHQL